MNKKAPPDRELLAMAKPPKPIGEMTDDELDAWADAIFDMIVPKDTDSHSA